MRTEHYMNVHKCEHYEKLMYLENTDKRYLSYASNIEKLCALMKNSLSNEDDVFSEACVKKVLDPFREQVKESFLNYDWLTENQKDVRICMDQRLYNRFYEWLAAELLGAKIHMVNHSLAYGFHPDVEQKEDILLLETPVNLVYEKDGQFFALYVHFGKNNKMSETGKSISTMVDAYPEHVMLKCALEKEYPNICVKVVFFEEGADEKNDCLKPWKKGTKNGNEFSLFYEDCYETTEDGRRFCPDLCLAKFYQYLEAERDMSPIKRCEHCFLASFCQLQTISHRKPCQTVQSGWVLPKFDEAQERFAHFGHGRMLCTAPPGSGKTAALIGRVLEFGKQNGVSTEQMLLVSFTEKAALEMRERLECYLDEDDMPFVGTIHAIGVDIIRTYERMFKLPKSKLLTKSGEKRLLHDLLQDRPNLKGVSYNNFKSGKFSTVETVLEKLKSFQLDEELMISRNPNYDPAEWRALRDDWEKMLSKEHYISYDDIIIYSADILENNPSVKSFYANLYKYIMVDEYQDVEKQKDRLISLLSETSGELVCIGDIDQSIFGWTGCDSQYMLDFKVRYPDATVLSLDTNYRSVPAIVTLCDSILHQEQKEKHRTVKQGGKAPFMIADNSTEVVEECIASLLRNGYQERDIAVIARTWKPLELLESTLSVRTELAKALLINDFLFRVTFYTLSYLMEQDKKNSLLMLGYLYEKPKVFFGQVKEMLEDTKKMDSDLLNLLTFCKQQLSENTSARHYVARLASYLDLEDSESELELLKVVENNDIKEIANLRSVLESMIVYMDDKKIDYPITDAVTLISSHSAKGKEWRAVILLDSDSYRGTLSKEDNNVLYVSLSRAKETLVCMKKSGTVSVLDENPYLKKVSF